MNVSLSRKGTLNYQSRGAGVGLTAELDLSLLNRPQDLQAQVAGLFVQARTALDRAWVVAGAELSQDSREPLEST